MKQTDYTYINNISFQLEQFKRKRSNLFNFRCPYCGDSKTKKNKLRGFLYEKGNDMFYRCHNCGIGRTFSNFLKDNFAILHQKYLFDRYRDNNTGKNSCVSDPDFSKIVNTPVFRKKLNLPSIDSLEDSHYAKVYIMNRIIPTTHFNSMYFAKSYKQFVTEILPDFDVSTWFDESRLVIPFYDKSKKLIAFQGRSFINSSMKYITIKMHDDYEKIYGLDKVDTKREHFVVEGPIDSMFIENSIATTDSNLTHYKGNDNTIYVFDNEPRNSITVDHMSKTIDMNKRICIFPDNITSNDINDMILNDKYTQEELKNIMISHTYNGLSAKLRLKKWRKC